MFTDRLPEVLKRSRENLGMSITEFADYVGTSKQNISSYESGKFSPKLDIASKIAKKLGLSLSELCGEASQSEKEVIPSDLKQDADVLALLKTYQSLPEDRRKQLLEYSEALRLLTIHKV